MTWGNNGYDIAARKRLRISRDRRGVNPRNGGRPGPDADQPPRLAAGAINWLDPVADGRVSHCFRRGTDRSVCGRAPIAEFWRLVDRTTGSCQICQTKIGTTGREATGASLLAADCGCQLTWDGESIARCEAHTSASDQKNRLATLRHAIELLDGRIVDDEEKHAEALRKLDRARCELLASGQELHAKRNKIISEIAGMVNRRG